MFLFVFFVIFTFTPDTEAPVITAENKTVEYGKEPDYMSGVSAVDNVDGDLTESIELDTSQVDIYMAGQYSVTYTVSDAAGNQGKKEIIVTVKQKAVPVQETTASGSQASGYTALSVEDAVEIKTEGGEQTGGNVIVQPQQQPAEEVPDIPQTPETPAAASGFDTGKADELLVLVNAERQARGLGAVTAKDSLTERAKERAQSGNGSGSGVILCRGTGATSASIVVDTWNRDWPEGTWMTEAWK